MGTSGLVKRCIEFERTDRNIGKFFPTDVNEWNREYKHKGPLTRSGIFQTSGYFMEAPTCKSTLQYKLSYTVAW